MIQVGNTRRVAQADGRGFSKLGMEESGSESRPPVASARMENEWNKKTNDVRALNAVDLPAARRAQAQVWLGRIRDPDGWLAFERDGSDRESERG
ncbi:hypothetical protein PRIPAC_78999 [Pristionchus pacificus]|uniref:Uncharacterized protein n=1 Tax=Pristionchus pacificus TaxID=54126 RepID=A0A2A6CNS4_PRIPA|nr:hypothetical protein PRIPAC_78999 [Pristionchus pacificus]|eukprot:PDM79852.1 hypothetical protein PRIPAC_32431 [Pristionchus pacificus]